MSTLIVVFTLKGHLTLRIPLFQWFNFSHFCSDVEVYSSVCQYTLASLLDVVTDITEHTSDHASSDAWRH